MKQVGIVIIFLLSISANLSAQRLHAFLQVDSCHSNQFISTVLIKNHTTKLLDSFFISHPTTTIQQPLPSSKFHLIPDTNYWFHFNDSSIIKGYGFNRVKTIDTGCFYSLSFSDTTTFLGDRLNYPIYFKIFTDSLSESSLIIIEDWLFPWLVKHHFARIEIGVHFDERCPPEFSNCLSCQRANAIKNELIRLGIDENRLAAKGYQGFKPIYKKAKTERQHRINRRVEITVIGI